MTDRCEMQPLGQLLMQCPLTKDLKTRTKSKKQRNVKPSLLKVKTMGLTRDF